MVRSNLLQVPFSILSIISALFTVLLNNYITSYKILCFPSLCCFLFVQHCGIFYLNGIFQPSGNSLSISCATTLTHFSPVSYFCTPWKRQKTLPYLSKSMMIFYKKLHKFKRLQELPKTFKNSKNNKNWKKNPMRFSMFYKRIWQFVTSVKYEQSSQFVSYPITLKFWVKLQSPVGYILMLITWLIVINIAPLTVLFCNCLLADL